MRLQHESILYLMFSAPPPPLLFPTSLFSPPPFPLLTVCVRCCTSTVMAMVVVTAIVTVMVAVMVVVAVMATVKGRAADVTMEAMHRVKKW